MNAPKYIYIVQVTRQLSIDILNRFAENGAEIELVTGVVESNYRELSPNIKVKYFIKYNNTSSFKRLFTWLVFTIRSFFYVLFKSTKHELILVTTPPFIVFLGLFFKKIRNQKYHLIIWDLYPDVLVSVGMFNEKSLFVKCWKKLNKPCFNRAENLFTLGVHLSNAIKKYTDKTPIIIPNWVNADFVKPIEKSNNLFASKYGLQNKFVVMYSGNMGLTHDIESIVYAAELLKDKTSIQFVLIGDGAKKEKIENLVTEKKLINILMLPYQPKEMLPYSLTCADVGVVTLSDGAESVSVPSKTYYTLAAGSLVLALAAKQSELGLLIKKYECGKVFEKSSPQVIADFIVSLPDNQLLLNKYKENSRKASLDFTPLNANIYYKYICDTV